MYMKETIIYFVFTLSEQLISLKKTHNYTIITIEHACTALSLKSEDRANCGHPKMVSWLHTQP
jgi:hypothetical protein